MKHPVLILAFLAIITLAVNTASADVVVLANRTSIDIPVQLSPVGRRPFVVKLPSGESTPVFSDQRLQISYRSGSQRATYALNANSAYFFTATPAGGVALQQIGLGDDDSTSGGRALPGDARSAPHGIIPIKIWVDEEEPSRRHIWERKLRKRVEAASDVLDRHAAIKLQVVGVGSWQSDNGTTDFFDSLTEFEKEASPGGAQLCIGFTSQYQVMRGRTHLGGTRGPLSSHILLREWSQHVSEPERLELLIHELGHFLGASHSPEQDSVMRPVLGDRQSREKSFQIRFDPVNTLIISMVGEEVRRRRVQSFSAMTPGSTRRLKQVYASLGQAFPDDPAAKIFSRIVSSGKKSSLIAGVRQVLFELTVAAAENRRLTPNRRHSGDALTNYYVRRAAEAASRLPKKHAKEAFLIGIGIGLDRSSSLHSLPQTRSLVQKAEPNSARAARVAMMGKPTALNRDDLVKHFAVSAHLAAALSPEAANTLGLAKEVSDASGGSGFSFVDLSADRAGVELAKQLLSGRLRLEKLAEQFQVNHFLPSVADLDEGLPMSEVEQRYGGLTDIRFKRRIAQIDDRIRQLPPYVGITKASAIPAGSQEKSSASE